MADEKVKFPDQMTEAETPADLDKIMVSRAADGKKPWWISFSKLKTWWNTLYAKKDASNLDDASKSSWNESLKIAINSDQLKDATDKHIEALLINGFYYTDGSTTGLPEGINANGLLSYFHHTGDDGTRENWVYQTQTDGVQNTYFKYKDEDHNGEWVGVNQVDTSLYLLKSGVGLPGDSASSDFLRWQIYIALYLSGKPVSELMASGLDADMSTTAMQSWFNMNTKDVKLFLKRLADLAYQNYQTAQNIQTNSNYNSIDIEDIQARTLFKDNTDPFTPDADYEPATKKFVEDTVATAGGGDSSVLADLDCSTDPDYPAGTSKDKYYVTVAGKIGGAGGKAVEVGDQIVCKSDNAGGDEATVGSSWFVLQGNTEKATQSEAEAGTNDIKYLTPLKTLEGFKNWVVNTVHSALNTTSKTLTGAINEIRTLIVNHEADQANPHGVTAAQTGAIPASEKGAANGVAELGADSKIVSDQLPSYVDDVVEGYLDLGDTEGNGYEAFYEEDTFTTQIAGEAGKIYSDLTPGENKTYRWGGTAFVNVSNPHTHSNKSNLDSIDQNLSEESNVQFKELLIERLEALAEGSSIPISTWGNTLYGIGTYIANDVGSPAFGLFCASLASQASSEIKLVRSANTLANPQSVNNGVKISSIIASGFDGSNFQDSAAITFKVDDNTGIPIAIIFETGSSSVNRTERMRIKSDGEISISEKINSPNYLLNGAALNAALGLLKLDASALVPIANLPSSVKLALGETSATAYRGDRGKAAYDAIHAHANKSSIDKIDESSGRPTYNGDGLALYTEISADTIIGNKVVKTPVSGELTIPFSEGKMMTATITEDTDLLFSDVVNFEGSIIEVIISGLENFVLTLPSYVNVLSGQINSDRVLFTFTLVESTSGSEEVFCDINSITT